MNPIQPLYFLGSLLLLEFNFEVQSPDALISTPNDISHPYHLPPLFQMLSNQLVSGHRASCSTSLDPWGRLPEHARAFGSDLNRARNRRTDASIFEREQTGDCASSGG